MTKYLSKTLGAFSFSQITIYIYILLAPLSVTITLSATRNVLIKERPCSSLELSKIIFATIEIKGDEQFFFFMKRRENLQKAYLKFRTDSKR